MVEILQGDCLKILPTLPAGSVHCCVTSPPYWGLRDYGTASWEGGDPDCDHQPDKRGSRFATPVSTKQASNTGSGTASLRDCPCGARRIDAQVGLERTPSQYVEKLVAVFAQVHRVLRDDGTLWLNLGDSYAGGGRGGNPDESPFRKQATNAGSVTGMAKEPWPVPAGLKCKDLVGIPWRVAFALQDAGWWLRQDIIWHKPNPMPESVTDRCTKAHEYLFLLAKSERYYFNQEAILEPIAAASEARLSQNIDEQLGSDRVPGKTNGRMKAVSRSGNKSRKSARGVPVDTGGNTNGAVDGSVPWEGSDRNKRSVWTVTTQPYRRAHFATFPPQLITPCILAGCPEGGTVLDPFLGSGTTALVADRNGCNCIGIELNHEYVKLAEARVQQRSLFTGMKSDG